MLANISFRLVYSKVIRLFGADKYCMSKHKCSCHQTGCTVDVYTITQPALLMNIYLMWLRHKCSHMRSCVKVLFTLNSVCHRQLPYPWNSSSILKLHTVSLSKLVCWTLLETKVESFLDILMQNLYISYFLTQVFFYSTTQWDDCLKHWLKSADVKSVSHIEINPARADSAFLFSHFKVWAFRWEI